MATKDKNKQAISKEKLLLRVEDIRNSGIIDDIIREAPAQMKEFGFDNNISQQVMAVAFTGGLASYNRYVQNKTEIPLRYFLLFCLAAGFDVQALAENAHMRKTEAPLREIGVYMGNLSDQTLQAIQFIIENSGESDFTKKRGAFLLQKLRDIPHPQYIAYGENPMEAPKNNPPKD